MLHNKHVTVSYYSIVLGQDRSRHGDANLIFPSYRQVNITRSTGACEGSQLQTARATPYVVVVDEGM